MPWWWRRVFNSRPINWRAYSKCTHKCMEIFKLSKLSNFICIHLILFSDFHLLPLELVVFAYTGHQALFKMMITVSENVRNEWLECVISSFSDIFFLFRTSSLASLFCCKMIIFNGLVDAGRSCRICWPLRREREKNWIFIWFIDKFIWIELYFAKPTRHPIWNMCFYSISASGDSFECLETRPFFF